MSFKTRLNAAVAKIGAADINLESAEFKEFRKKISLMESTKILLRERRHQVLTEATFNDVMATLVKYAQNNQKSEIGPQDLQMILGVVLRSDIDQATGQRRQFNSREEMEQEIQALQQEILPSSDLIARELAKYNIRWVQQAAPAAPATQASAPAGGANAAPQQMV